MDFSLGIIFGLLSMIGYGLDTAISQIPIRKIGSAETVFFRNIFMVLILFLVFLFSMPTSYDISFILLALAIGVFGYLPLLAYCKALKVDKVGVVAPVSSSSIIFTVLLSIIFFSETLALSQLFSIALIIAGVILIALNPNDWKNSFAKLSSGIFLALIASIGWGLVYFLLKIPVNIIGPILTSLLLEAGVLIASGAHLALSKSGFRLPSRQMAFLIFLVAITGAAGTLFFNLGVQVSAVSIVAALSMSFPLVATLYGRFVYKEKLARLQWLAVALIISGIMLLQLVG